MTKPKESTFLDTLEREIRKVLKDPDISPSDRLKAIEAGAKLLAVRHKVTGESGDGSFFRK
jgi:hypothetical protein